MSRRKKDPLRPLTDAESEALTQLSRSQAAPAAQVARAAMLLAVARGDDYQQAAGAAGRRSGDAVSHLVARFNAEGLAALTPRHGGGHPAATIRRHAERILREVKRPPTPEADGTATWSLSTLRKALRARARRPAAGLDLHPLAGAPRGRLQPSEYPHLVPHRHRPAPPQGRRGGRHRPGRRAQKKLIEDAYRLGEAMGLPVWCTDQAGPFQTIPYPGPSWQAGGRAGPPAPRVPPRRHGQGPDAVPPGRRPGPRARA